MCKLRDYQFWFALSQYSYSGCLGLKAECRAWSCSAVCVVSSGSDGRAVPFQVAICCLGQHACSNIMFMELLIPLYCSLFLCKYSEMYGYIVIVQFILMCVCLFVVSVPMLCHVRHWCSYRLESHKYDSFYTGWFYFVSLVWKNNILSGKGDVLRVYS